MSEADNLSERVRELIGYHSAKKQETPEQTLNRLLDEYVCGAPHLTFETLCVTKESWGRDGLSRICRRHNRASPCPRGANTREIVVASFRGRHYAIDGNNRINHWLKKGETGPFQILLIEV